MLRAISVALVVSVFVGMASIAEASSIPMLTDTTSGGVTTTMFADDFETTSLSLPDWPAATEPSQGTWTNNIGGGNHSVLAVTNQAIAGVPANEGSQFLSISRPAGYNGSAIIANGASTASGDLITMKFAIWSGSGETSLFPLYSGNAGATLSQIVFGSNTWTGGGPAYGVGIDKPDDSDYQWLNATLNPNAWNNVTITHTNGTADWSMSINGSTPETKTSFANGLTQNVYGFKLQSDVSSTATVCYFDAQQAVPEPSTLVMTVGALFGLLAYAWKKRR